ncbi:hypothetical protein ABZ743_24110 [Streptomyces sp. NPDC006662]|uniref:hypothetical protein n=1 Tax=Streptomyces sp. NPDC006662 TaxID=3156902 RepID=UPI0033E84D8A
MTSLAAGSTVRLYAVADGRVYGRDLNTRTGSWTGWGELPGGATGVKDVAASLVGDNVELQIVGANGALRLQYGNYDAGHWNTSWTDAGGTGLSRVTSHRGARHAARHPGWMNRPDRAPTVVSSRARSGAPPDL